MSAGWLVYALVTGALLSLAAYAIEGVARARCWPMRWIWAAAMAATFAAILGAVDTRGGAVPATLVERVATASASPDVAVASTLVALALDVRAMVEATIVAGVAALTRPVPGWIGGAVGLLWLLGAAAAVTTLTLVHARLRRARRSWPAADLLGRRVRIAPSVGPAVVGIVRPEIVVPQWLLRRTAREQQLVLAHEEEHVRARDPLLLGAACVAVALMPWHPAAWWMLARLRLAIELDCDARVLGRGVPVRSYGDMLIDLAGQCSGFRVGATALADKTSHLERRLLAMRPIPKRYSLVRAATLCGAAGLLLVAACEARVPTSAEIQSMDVESAERTAAKTGLIEAMHGVQPEFYVNGAKVSAAEAHAIVAKDIATVDVQKARGVGEPSLIRITTVAVSSDGTKYRSAGPGAAGRESRPLSAFKGLHERMSRSNHTFGGVVLIDGTRADAAALHRLDPKDIAGVEIIKGAQATQLSSDPAAKNGIIKVTTIGARTRG